MAEERVDIGEMRRKLQRKMFSVEEQGEVDQEEDQGKEKTVPEEQESVMKISEVMKLVEQLMARREPTGDRNINIQTVPDLSSTIGEIEDGDNVAEWVKQLEYMRVQQKMSDEGVLSIAISRVKGRIENWHRAIGKNNTTWVTWKAELEREFGKKLTLRQWVQKVENRRQGKNEKLIEYVYAKMKLLRSRNPVEVRVEDELDFMIDGMWDAQQKLTLAARKIESMEQLIETAKEIDARQEKQWKKSEESFERSRYQDVEKRVHRFQEKWSPVENFGRGNRGNSDFRRFSDNNHRSGQRNEQERWSTGKREESENNMKKIRCYKCQQTGHLARNCKEPVKCYKCQNVGHIATNCLEKTEKVGLGETKTVTMLVKNQEEKRGKLPYVQVEVEGMGMMEALIDSGSELSVINARRVTNSKQKNFGEEEILRAFDGQEVRTKGRMELIVNKDEKTWKLKNVAIVEGAQADLVLGCDWLEIANSKLNWNNGKFHLGWEDDKEKTKQTVEEEVSIKKISDVLDNFQWDVKKWEEIINPELSEQIKTRMLEVLKRNGGVFMEDDGKLGCYKDVEHKIELIEEKPIRQKPYNYTWQDRKFIQETVGELLKKKIIEPSSSEYASPVVIVKRPDHTTTPFRMCIDYRKLNEVTRKDAYPMPRIDDLMERLSGAKFFTKLDMKSGYWQLVMREEDVGKTAFITNDGLFQFRRMPFGLMNAPATFQRVMNKILRDRIGNGILVYMDDVLVYTKDEKSHEEMLDWTLKQFKEAGLKLNQGKCRIMETRIQYLGYIIDENGKKPDEKKVEAIKQYKEPKNKKELQSFLGLTSYYRRYVKDFAKLSGPLRKLVKKDTTFEWNDEAKKSFEALKQKMMKPPILKHYRPECETEVHTDASKDGLGAVLIQKQDGREAIVEYASRRTTEAEAKMHSNELESVAVHWAVAEKFRQYLMGRKFVVKTDNWSVKQMKAKGRLNRRFAKMVLDLQEYDFAIEFKPGRENVLADGLSRTICALFDEKSDKNITREEQDGDNFVKRIKKFFEEEKLSAEEKKEGKTMMERYKVRNGLLYIRDIHDHGKYLLVVPEQRKKDILRMCHDEERAGHLGVEKTVHRILDRFWWKGLVKEVYEYVKGCEECQRNNIYPAKRQTRMRKREIPQRPFEMLSIDHVGPLPTKTKNGKRWILVIIDHCSKYVITEGVASLSTKTTLEVLKRRVFNIFGNPKIIISDNGTSFTSGEFQEEMKKRNVKTQYISAYHPESNGLVERINQTLQGMLRKYVGDKPETWLKYLQEVTYAYNTARQSSTQKTPFYLIYGFVPKAEIDGGEEIEDFLREEKLEELRIQREEGAQNMAEEDWKQMSRENKNRNDHQYEKQEKVLYKIPHKEKLGVRWEGPYEVKEKIGEVNYEIEHCETGKWKQAHASQLKPFCQ